MKYKLKTTVLKASKQLAEEISAELLKVKTFKRRELVEEQGFEIYAPGQVLFRFTQTPAPRFDYLSELITIN